MRLIVASVFVLGGVGLYAALQPGREVRTLAAAGGPGAPALLVAAAVLGLAGGTAAALWADHPENKDKQ